MRLLFYGLQNSGATLLTLLAGQRPNSLVIPDLWTMFCAPRLDTELDMCVKATITSSFPLDEHLAAYKPDHVFLVVRRPVDNLASLRRKHYARHNGTLEQKFAVADDSFTHPERFTDVLVFESIAADPEPFVSRLAELGWELPEDASAFPRTSLEMERHLWDQVPDLYGQVQWGAGEARIEPLGTLRVRHAEDAEAADFARDHAPHLHQYYERRGTTGAEQVALHHTAQDDAAMQNRSNYVRSMLGIFEGLLRDDRGPEALELACELTELAPHSLEAWNARARALEHCGSVELAVDLWAAAGDHLGEGSEDRARLGVTMARQAVRLGHTERALELTSALVKEHEGFTPAHLLHAELSVRIEEWTAAQEHAERVLAAQPRNVIAALTLANSFAGQGRVPQAVRLLESCLAIQPDFDTGRRRLAELLTAAEQPASDVDHR